MRAQITMDWEMGSAVTDFRLVDVPELGYHTTDWPFPRGELQLKTQSMIKGYHKQAKARLFPWSHVVKHLKGVSTDVLRFSLQMQDKHMLAHGFSGWPQVPYEVCS